jgi:hypothetical protein
VITLLRPFSSNCYSPNLVWGRSFLGGCTNLHKPSYLSSLYKRGGAEYPGLSKRVGSMKRFLKVVAAVTLSAMDVAIAEQVVSVLLCAPLNEGG